MHVSECSPTKSNGRVVVIFYIERGGNMAKVMGKTVTAGT
jgi:hypothetical protein